MGLLEGKTALITGAARGIGKAIALKFAEEGANIAFTDLEVNEETEKEIAAKGVKAKSYASNAADFAQTEEVVKAVKEEFGSIDILVNNAGITKDGLMLRMTEQQWDAVIAVNLKSAFNFIHACVPVMMRQRGGSIINMASVVGVHGNAGQANYAASKAGLIAFGLSSWYSQQQCGSSQTPMTSGSTVSGTAFGIACLVITYRRLWKTARLAVICNLPLAENCTLLSSFVQTPVSWLSSYTLAAAPKSLFSVTTALS